MKKITIFNLHLGVGGIEKYLSGLVKMLEKDYEVELIITYKLLPKPYFDFSNNIKIKYLIDDKPNKEEVLNAIKNKKLILLVKELFKSIKILLLKKYYTIKEIKNINSDIVITTRTYETELVNKYLKDKKVIKIATDHNYPDERYKKRLINAVTNHDKLIVVNDEIKKIYKPFVGEKVITIPNFIDYKIKLSKGLNTKSLIAVGRFSEEKGFLDLIDIMNILVFKNSSIKLNLIGDGAMMNQIKFKVKELNLEKNVVIHGYLNSDGIKKLLNKSSIYCMTSFTESFGIVILEAMSFGLPIVAFDSASGPKELLKNNNGILVKNRSKEKFASEILRLLENDELREKYSNKSIERVKDFSFLNIKEKYLQAIADLIKEKNI